MTRSSRSRRRGERPDPHHRAGRDDLQQIFQPGSRPRNLEMLAAATLEASLLQPRQSAPRDEYLTAMEQLSALAFKAYRGLVYETEGFVGLFLGARPSSPKSRRSTSAAGRPRARKPARSRICAPSPGCSAGRNAGSCCRAGTASAGRSRPGSRDIPNRAWRSCRSSIASGRSSARCCRTWTWCWRRADRDRLALRGTGAGRDVARKDLRPHLARMAASIRRCWTSWATSGCCRAIRCWSARSATGFPIWIRSTTCRSNC